MMFVFRISIDFRCQIEKKNKVLSNKAESHMLYKQSILTREATACASSWLDPIFKCIVRRRPPLAFVIMTGAKEEFKDIDAYGGGRSGQFFQTPTL